jgi:hypothetical protein
LSPDQGVGLNLGNHVSITKVQSRADRRRFVDVPFKIYAGDPAWVPPLTIERLDHIGRRNPYFEHADAQLFLASRDGETVGRISAQIDRLHLERHADATGHFGFLEAVHDLEVFAELFGAAEEWLRARGMRRVRGPFSFSINDEAGLLVDGFDSPPFILMGHAPPYYQGAVEALGYVKSKDLLAYRFDVDRDFPKLASAIVEKAKMTGDLVVRPMSKKHLRRDLAIIIDIFNDAWSHNWGFLPMTSAEVDKLSHVLRFLVKDEYIAIAEYKGEPAAMMVSLPDINRWIADFNGRLLPFNWTKLLWRLATWRPDHFRIPLMGVCMKYRGTSIGGILALAVIDAVHRYHRARGAKIGELSWILEDNVAVRKIIEGLAARKYKTYRIYEKQLA